MYMEKIKFSKKILIGVGAVIFIIGVIALIYISNKKDSNLKMGSFLFDNQENGIVESMAGDLSEIQSGGLSGGSSEGLSNNVEKGRKEDDETIYIHIIGEVRNQGIIELKSGQRIIDAIEKAGGVTQEADISKVNLAFILSDGQKVKIPNINDKEENIIYVTDSSGKDVIIDSQMGVAIGNASGNNGVNGIKVNINTANQTELETLNGVGPSLAAKIIEYREKNGKFKNVEDLKNVSGIGEAKFEGIKNQVVIK